MSGLALYQVYVYVARYLVAPLTLAVASIMDLKSREIDVYIFLAGIMASLPASIITIMALQGAPLLPVYVVEDILVVCIIGGFVLLGLKGAADLFAFLVILAACPLPLKELSLFSPLFTVFFYYVMISILPVVALTVYNIVFNLREVMKLPMPYKIIYPLIAVPMRAKRLIEGKHPWWYPLNLCRYSIVYNINMDPEEVVEAVKKAMEEGCIKPDDIVWCSYGIPAIPLIFAAYTAFLALGEAPAIHIIKTLFGLR